MGAGARRSRAVEMQVWGVDVDERQGITSRVLGGSAAKSDIGIRV